MTTPRFGFFFWPWSPEYTARMVDLAERDEWDLVGIADTPGNAMDPWVALTLAAVPLVRAAEQSVRETGAPLVVVDGGPRSAMIGGE